MRKIIVHYLTNIIISSALPTIIFIDVYRENDDRNFILIKGCFVFLCLILVNSPNFLLLIKTTFFNKIFFCFFGTVIPAFCYFFYHFTNSYQGYTFDFLIPYIASIINLSLNISFFIQNLTTEKETN
jgi:hypothetical protein